MTPLQRAWAAVRPRLKLVEPVPFSPDDWAVLERLHANFNDREAQTHLPLPIARFRAAASQAIHEQTKHFDDVQRGSADDASDAMAGPARLYNDDVDAMMGVLVPSAHFRKGHHAYGRFTVAEPHGLHTDHSAEDPSSAGEPICIARIETLATHYLAGDYRTYDAGTKRMIEALRYWTEGDDGGPEEVLAELLKRGTLKSIPVDHVVLMVAGNASANTQVTQHIAARPPPGGLHSAFFQRQYRLAP